MRRGVGLCNGLALVLQAMFVTALPADEVGGKPNVVLIVADDLGYGELGCQGNREIPTPHIDSIAANGVRFTNGYVSCPVCSPTRAGLLTGRYQQRFGHEFNPGPTAAAAPTFGLAKSETALQERMKLLGYATGMVGKWHLGFVEEFQPLQRGFDRFYGFLGGAHPYLGSGVGPRREIRRGNEAIKESEYLTDAFAREAVDFIEAHKDRPFFLYLPFNAVHNPLEATAEYRERVSAIKDAKRQTFAAMLIAMDDAVGRVLGTLRERKLVDKTLVIFISDNGGPTPQTTSKNGALRGTKGTVFEGGIRVPFAMQWKGRLPAGKVEDRPVIALDIHPTVVAATGTAIDPSWKLDGVNLLPYLTGENSQRPHESFYWRYGSQWAIRFGDWKLLGSGAGETPALYQLADDVGEAKDRAGDQPEIAARLLAEWKRWNAELQNPKWERANAKSKAKAKAQRKNRKKNG